MGDKEVTKEEKLLQGVEAGMEEMNVTPYEADMPPEKREKIQEMRKLHEQRVKLEEEFEAERVALLLKYQQLEGPMFTARRNILVGEDAACTTIENFWCQAMSNSALLREMLILGERDTEALGYLLDVSCQLLEDARSYMFKFEFAENPFFENKVLTKKYFLDEDGDPCSAEGCEINWKAGKNLTVKIKKKKRGGKGRPAITKSEPCETFFNWFTPPEPEDSEDDLDEDVAEELSERIETDFDIGMCLKDKIIPHAIMWYTGEAEDSDDEEDDEESDEESDSDEDGPPVQEGLPQVAPPGAEGQQDCKQQ